MTNTTQGATNYSPATQQLLAQYWNAGAILAAWNQAATELAKLVDHERRLRTAVFETHFPAHTEGVNRTDIGNGYQLKATAKYNYNLKNKNGETEMAIEAIAKLGEKGAFIADRLIRWQPELSVSEYRKLDDTIKKEIDKVLEIKPGMPALEIEAPKS